MLLAASAGAAEGDWLIADCQTAGRGRMARRWESPVGNLYASGLVRLRPSDPQAATLAFVAVVALFDAAVLLQKHDSSPKTTQLSLKWPNDLLVGTAKLAGILLERVGDAVVVGVGVNLAHHPENIGRPVTSFAAISIVPPEPTVFLETLTEIFARWLSRWRVEGVSVIRKAWLDRAHPIGTALVAKLPDRGTVEGLFDGLTEACALRLRLADGSVRVIHAGDVFLI